MRSSPGGRWARTRRRWQARPCQTVWRSAAIKNLAHVVKFAGNLIGDCEDVNAEIENIASAFAGALLHAAEGAAVRGQGAPDAVAARHGVAPRDQGAVVRA